MEHTPSPVQDDASPPGGFREVRTARGWGWARPEVLPWFSDALTRFPSLYEAARDQVARSESEGPTLQGRAPVFVLSLGSAALAVRHYYRGGAIASFLGDRYLRVGPPRPLSESFASETLRSLGIPTPRVMAAAVYPSGPFYRGDIATEFIRGGVDLGEYLFGGGGERASEPTQRMAALAEAGALIERLRSAGMLHPDLNVKNFLVEPGTAPLKVHILDLDRCRAVQRGAAGIQQVMVRRFRSSLAKWEKITGRRLSQEEWGVTGYIPRS